MEDLAPNLRLAVEVRLHVERGNSVRQAIREIVAREDGDWAHRLRQLIIGFEIRKELEVNGLRPETVALFQLLQRGWNGEAVLDSLLAIEEEIYRQNEYQIEEFAAILPVRMLAPLLLLQFPAFLILILGPLLSRFMSNL